MESICVVCGRFSDPKFNSSTHVQGALCLEDLPYDILVKIAEQLPYRCDINSLRLVNKRCKAAVNDASVSLSPSKDIQPVQLRSLSNAFHRATSLDLHACPKLDPDITILSLPSLFPDLARLRFPGDWLTPEDDLDLEELFPKHRELDLCSSAAQLTALPAGIIRLASLQSLHLTYCTSIAQLPEELSQLKSLRDLNVSGCPLLRELPEGLSRMSSLEHLSFWGCSALCKLPDELGTLSALRTLSLGMCPRLEALPACLTGEEVIIGYYNRTT